MKSESETVAPADLRRLLPIVLTQAVGFLCGVAGIKIASHLITPSAYGAYGVFLTLTPLGISVVHAGLLKYVARYWATSNDRAELLRNVVRAAVRKMPLLAIATFAAVWLVPGLHGGEIGSAWWSTWMLLFAGAALMSLALIAQTALQAGREHWKDFGASAVGSVTRSFAPPLFYAAAGGALVALQAGFVIHATALALAAWWALKSRSGRPDRFENLSDSEKTDGKAAETSASTLKVSLGIYDGPLFIVLAIAAWAVMAANRWIVAGFFGNETAGFFTLAGNIAVIVTSMLGVVFVQYWQPVFFGMPSETADDRRALAARVDIIALAYTFCGLAGIGFLHVVTPWLTGILIDAKYVNALAMIAPAGCFGIAFVTGQFFHILLLAGKKERACAAADLSGAAVLVVGGVIAAALGGETWFMRWLLITPLVPWVLQRTLARRALIS